MFFSLRKQSWAEPRREKHRPVLCPQILPLGQNFLYIAEVATSAPAFLVNHRSEGDGKRETKRESKERCQNKTTVEQTTTRRLLQNHKTAVLGISTWHFAVILIGRWKMPKLIS